MLVDRWRSAIAKIRLRVDAEGAAPFPHRLDFYQQLIAEFGPDIAKLIYGWLSIRCVHYASKNAQKHTLDVDFLRRRHCDAVQIFRRRRFAHADYRAIVELDGDTRDHLEPWEAEDAASDAALSAMALLHAAFSSFSAMESCVFIDMAPGLPAQARESDLEPESWDTPYFAFIAAVGQHEATPETQRRADAFWRWFVAQAVPKAIRMGMALAERRRLTVP